MNENEFKQELNNAINNCIEVAKSKGITKDLGKNCMDVYIDYYDRYTQLNKDYYGTEIWNILMYFGEWCSKLTRVCYETTQANNAMFELEKAVIEGIES